MAYAQRSFTFETSHHDEIVDVTDRVNAAIGDAKVTEGICTIFTPHATAAITVNENDDPNIGGDLIRALRKVIVDHDGWLHDRVDNNAASHIKSAIVGPSVSIPIERGRLLLGTWQNVFFCEFDGPRRQRRVVVAMVW
jgi:secondary thiamine-phosphate synthase enzyme